MTTRKWTVIPVAAMLAAGLVAGTAPAAHATPTGCTTSVTSDTATATAHCTGGTGQYRVAVSVLHANPSVGWVANWGPWVTAGNDSSCYVPPGTIMSLRVEKR
ncbi:hypothetical protein [Sphaerimonospora mesophila]|uniref:hypothetical protein n=1 Tax=Sphaerimonospora mesophila TaxID=37483 RepID=UPI0006E30112